MNTKAINSAAGVINAALTQGRTAAGIALALDSAGLLITPETAAELEQLRARFAVSDHPADEDPIAYALTGTAESLRPVAEGETYWRVGEPDKRVKVVKVWQYDTADEPAVSFDISGKDWRGDPCTSHSALPLSRFRELYRLDSTVPQPKSGGAS
ncbi:hypothetical protein [Streptomyces sp. STR69]|uniref:hypothetical protein n=1 Tax=Streptomyces sp. STR69 TaxID=1796942 RepID=UPI0021C5C235|nr:hypothetical protein [Streptomyces sp. STR69]